MRSVLLVALAIGLALLSSRGRRLLMILPVAVLATGCGTVHPIAEYTHLSHATQHFGAHRTNYGTDIVSGGIRWRPEVSCRRPPCAAVTIDLMEGAALQGLHGRTEVFTGRVNIEFGGAK